MSFEVILTDETASKLRETFRWREDLSPQGAARRAVKPDLKRAFERLALGITCVAHLNGYV